MAALRERFFELLHRFSAKGDSVLGWSENVGWSPSPELSTLKGFLMSDDNWLMRIENGLSAHFKEEDGVSRPGVHWTVGLKRGEQTYTVLVKALLADDATAETRKDEEYQMQTTMQYLNDQLQSGWHPDQDKEHIIYIGNPLVPLPHRQATAKKPWWRFW